MGDLMGEMKKRDLAQDYLQRGVEQDMVLCASLYWLFICFFKLKNDKDCTMFKNLLF